MRWMLTGLLLLSLGCATQRNYEISTTPLPADIKIDGADHGNSPVTQQLMFNSDSDLHQISASRPGFLDQTVQVSNSTDPHVVLHMAPVKRRVTFTVLPFPAKLSVNGKPISDGPVSTMSVDLDFPTDATGKQMTYTVTADRPGFASAQRTVSWADRDAPNYVLTLQPMHKDVTIDTVPSGARIFIDDEEVGQTPLTEHQMAFNIDPQTGQWNEYHLRVVKPGYDPIDTRISWDDSKTDYTIPFAPKTKTVRILTDPPNAIVTIDGQAAERDAQGLSSAKLTFPPTDDRGDLSEHEAVATKKTNSSEWEPARLTIGWDDGKTDYDVHLREVLTTPVPMLSIDFHRGDDDWQLLPRNSETLAMKDVNEGADAPRPTKLTNLDPGSQVDSLAISPDGSQLMFTLLSEKNGDLRSQLMLMSSDGGGGLRDYSDDQSLDIHPSFTPDGKEIVFSSNRGGRLMSVWTQSAAGAPGVTQQTNNDSNDIWPSIDSDRRLFYESLIPSRSEPRIYMTELGKTTRTDLAAGQEPRVSPDTKWIVFTAVNGKTGKRGIYRMTADGGKAENLTNDPDADEFNPAWSPDGSQIAFVSDRGVDADKRHNYDIWILNVDHPEQPVQITSNGSWDDCPVWDTADVHSKAIYFRSNRGGEWAIWKIAVR